MVQITDSTLSRAVGVTSVEEHEVTTWPVIAGAPALATAPGTSNRSLASIIAYVLSIHNRRGKG